MQLVAVGAQDKFLIENPKITFYKTVYFRHTNFSMESIENYFNGNPELGHRITSTINRNGDLLKNLWLEVEMEGDLCNSTGHSLIEYVELEIGGQIIDTQYGEWMEILSELTLPEEKRLGYNKMINKTNVTTTTQIVFVTYEGTGTRSMSSGRNANADVIYCKLSDGTIIGRYDLHVTTNNIEIKLAENSNYIFDFDDRTNPETGDVQFVLTVNDVEVKHREKVKTPSVSSVVSSDTTRLDIYNVIQNDEQQYKRENRESDARFTKLGSEFVESKKDIANYIIQQRINPPDPIPLIIGTTEGIWGIIRSDTAGTSSDPSFYIVVPSTTINGTDPVQIDRDETFNVQYIFKGTTTDFTVSTALHYDTFDQLGHDIYLSDFPTGINYNGTIIDIIINNKTVHSYTISSEYDSLGYVPTTTEMQDNDYLVTADNSYNFTIYDMTSNTTRTRMYTGSTYANPTLTFMNNSTYKFLVKSIGHPFVIKDANDEIVGTTSDGAQVTDTGVEDGVYELTTTSEDHEYTYHCTNHTDSQNMYGRIINNTIVPEVEIYVLSVTTTSIVWVISVTDSLGTPLADLSRTPMWRISGKIKVAGTDSTTNDVEKIIDQNSIQIGFAATLTFENLSATTNYELYDFQWFDIDSEDILGTGRFPNFQQSTPPESSDIHPEFTSPSPPIRTTNSISWNVKQTNTSEFDESIILNAFVTFASYPNDMLNHSTIFTFHHDDVNDLVIFSNLFESTYWNVVYLTWRTASSPIPRAIEDLSFLHQDVKPYIKPDLYVHLISQETNTISCVIKRDLSPSSFDDAVTEPITVLVGIKRASEDRADDDLTYEVQFPAAVRPDSLVYVESPTITINKMNLPDQTIGLTYLVYRKSWSTTSSGSFHYTDDSTVRDVQVTLTV